ncbi:glycosyltransferase family 2 protein [Patescibacteria group bacterium]
MNHKKENKITVQLVTWNSKLYLPSCIKSLFDQTYRDFNILVIDNASRDGSIEWLKSNYPDIYILKNVKNLGYSRAHNHGLNLQHSPFVLLMNPDVILENKFLEIAIKTLEEKNNYASLCGKLKRFHFSHGDLNEPVDDGIIDATGLLIKRNYQVLNRGAGEKDYGQYNLSTNVFGGSGALTLYRRQALDAVAYKNQVLDETLFAYKEDVDIAWRLQLNGWNCWYEAKAGALHYREVKDKVNQSNKAIAQARKSKSSYVNYLSYRNHIMVVLKNAFISNYFRQLPSIAWYELKKLTYLLLREWHTLTAWKEVIMNLSKIKRYRKYNKQIIQRSPSEMKKWYQ